jgi:Tol biopolymer transport system component
MTPSSNETLERIARRIPIPEPAYERMMRRRDRKRRNQRIAAGVVGITVFVAAIWIVTSVGSVDRTQPAVPGGAETGPTPTPLVGTAPETASLIDLNTGEMTPLPESIAGGFSIAGDGYAVSPDGTMVTYVSKDVDGLKSQVFIASLDGTDVQQVTHDPRGAGFPDWSPDGAAIAYVSGVGDINRIWNIFVLDLATGETRQVVEPRAELGVGPLGSFSPRFSPDGASIVYWAVREPRELGGDVPWMVDQDDSSLRSVPVTGGESVLLVGGGTNDVQASWPTFSPDGSLAVECRGRLEGICIADADGTNMRELVSSPPVYAPEWSPDGTRIAYTIRATDNDRVFVVDVATGETTFVAEGIADDWLDDHTLIIEPAWTDRLRSLVTKDR